MAMDWVDFELGEDVRSATRIAQDQTWKEAVADGRVHFSHREANQIHAYEFQEAIKQFQIVQFLAGELHSSSSFLGMLTKEMMELVLHFALSAQHAAIVNSSILLKNISCNYFYRQRVVDSPLSALISSDNLNFPHQEFSIHENFRICVRKRPLNSHDMRDRVVYDCIEAKAGTNYLTAHDGRKARTGKRIHMDHRHYFFDRIWNEAATNLDVCQTEIQRLVNWAIRGLSSTLLCFGQTGTGKTYTLNAALDFTISSLVGHTIEVSFIELHGKKSYDLLSARKMVHLRSDESDNVHVRGARTIVTDVRRHTVHPILNQLHAALALRSCEVTERNPISSRSHAICVIKILESEVAAENTDENTNNSTSNPNQDSQAAVSLVAGVGGTCVSLGTLVADSSRATSTSGLASSTRTRTGAGIGGGHRIRGKIMLVDLAGSERNLDTSQMTPAQHRESAEINASLMALKGCFRAYQDQLQQMHKDRNVRYGDGLGDCGGTPGGSYLLAVAADTKLSNPNVVRAGGCCNSDKLPSCKRVSALSAPATATAARTGTYNTRPPYRASLLTRILKECFAADDRHRTLVIATVSPTSVDLMHTITTLEHVLNMSPQLSALASQDTVEVFIRGMAPRELPISDWSPDQLANWLAQVDGGRFAQLVLPTGIAGRQLAELTSNALSALFEGQLRAARRDEEGAAWVERGVRNRGTNALGSLLWRTLRREEEAIARYRVEMRIDLGQPRRHGEGAEDEQS